MILKVNKYKKAGVNINEGNNFVKLIKNKVFSTHKKGAIKDLNGEIYGGTIEGSYAFAVANIKPGIPIDVSAIADDSKGIFKFKFFESLHSVVASEGRTDEYWGTNVTSSNVNESLMIPIFAYIFFINKTKISNSQWVSLSSILIHI